MGRVASPYVPDDADRQLLRLLLAGGPVSGEEMSRELNMTRAAVWKRIAHLREMGYDIESAPRKGYWLAGGTYADLRTGGGFYLQADA